MISDEWRDVMELCTTPDEAEREAEKRAKESAVAGTLADNVAQANKNIEGVMAEIEEEAVA